MYKLFIVEDEFVIRQSLINSIDWNAISCKVIGDTDNGDIAIKLIEELKPDIVISDIRIYGRDGIEVCKFIHERLPEIKTLILTGYNDFSYAQSAIKYNIRDFILKPTSPEELLASVKKLTEEIDFEEQRKLQFDKLEEIMLESKGIMQEKYLIDLCNNNIPDAEKNKTRLDFLDINVKEYHAVAVEIDNYESFRDEISEKKLQLYKLGLRENINNILNKEKNGYYIEIGVNLSVIIMNKKSMHDVIELAEQIQKNIFNYFNINISFGISLLSSDIFRLNTFFEQAIYALRYKYYIGNGAIIYFGDINNEITKKYVDLFGNYSYIAHCVSVGNIEGANKGLSKLWQDVRISGSVDEKELRTIALQIILAIQNELAINNLTIESITCRDNFYENIIKADSVSQVDEIIKEIINAIVEHISTENSNNTTATIKKIYEFISINYSKSISLEDLGKEFYMNPNYLCRLIKKKTGENFTDILTKTRIEKAKELIKSSNYKTYEVAEKVGINDSRYFSQMFKKIEGVTPSEYKNKVG